MKETFLEPHANCVIEHSFWSCEESNNEDKNISGTTGTTISYLTYYSQPSIVRNVALVGHFKHGKTIFMDLLVEQSLGILTFDEDNRRHVRYTDTREDEQETQMSIKAVPMSLVLEDINATRYLCNILDTPGHVNFSDEMTVALRLADGAVLVVDAVDGVMLNTRRAIRHAIRDRLPIVVVMNKVDRLITDLKLAPEEAYQKLRDTIGAINNYICARTSTSGNFKKIDPAAGNVCFASGSAGWCFSLKSFAKLYLQLLQLPYKADTFVSRLWGDYSYNPSTYTFKKEPPSSRAERSFVSLILNPLFTLSSQVVKEDKSDLKTKLAAFRVTLSDDKYQLKTRPLRKLVFSSIFGSVASFTDMVVNHIPSFKEAAARKFEHICMGPKDTTLYTALDNCDPMGPLMVDIVKSYPKSDATGVYAFGRVYSGALFPQCLVRVLRDGYLHGDERDDLKAIQQIFVFQGCKAIPIGRAPPGMWVLIEGVSDVIEKTATLRYCIRFDDPFHVFRPLQFDTLLVLKTIIKVLNSCHLPQMDKSLGMINKCYPLASLKYEDSGVYTILCTGKQYSDSILSDLRKYCAVDFETIHTTVSYCETVVESSMSAEMSDSKFKITMEAEPLEPILVEDIQNGALRVDLPREKLGDVFQPREKLGDVFQTKYKWDLHDARSIWAFGPDMQGSNILMDGTFLSEDDQRSLDVVKASIVKGFQQGVSQGPLSYEPIRNVKFKIVDVTIAPERSQEDMLNISKIAQSVTCSAFFKARPLLMEPVYYAEINTPKCWVSSMHEMLSKKRGYIIHDIPLPEPLETTTCIVKAFLRVSESYDFEEKIQLLTDRKAFALLTFNHWTFVNGDCADEAKARKLMGI